MRPISFLVPGTTDNFRCGGLYVELQASRLINTRFPSEIVTYRQRELNHPYLDDELKSEGSLNTRLWIICWGFDVPRLLKILKGRAIAYHAHSCGYKFDLPPEIPILASSKNTLGYWGGKAKRNPLFLIQNCLEEKWIERGARNNNLNIHPHNKRNRSIDVLVQKRKNSKYVLKKLVPALIKKGLKVKVQSGWEEDLVGLFNDSKVIIYDSADFWNSHGLTEGFGLPPIEAIACGCVVFSSFNHGLSDILEPGRIGHQIGSGFLENDISKISSATNNPKEWLTNDEEVELLLSRLNETNLLQRWVDSLERINQHWDLYFKDDRPKGTSNSSIHKFQALRNKFRL